MVENPPFTKKTEGNFTGTEIELIERFAAKHGLLINYEEGSESELIKKLEKYELHLIIGGFEKLNLKSYFYLLRFFHLYLIVFFI
ncbi:transporter substrate-binding domain-containing protein [Autumnicola musiva]|uniref:transporter substrate-binding domain-containing protein n=1 Tax=Autumnicola musiva TaxID=3075589 RepID=UPI003D789C4A